jgi:GrpB-like predicted nucleotidyltransferase (UPF0157 family)
MAAPVPTMTTGAMCQLNVMHYSAEPPHCHEYDPLAAEVAQLIGKKIGASLPAVTVEHIGSTAVPGCAGKGIVDLMVVYPEGQLCVVKQTLADLGFQRQQVGHIMPESRPMRVGSLEYHGRTFPLHVHVIASASEEVEALRRFRERLRHDPALMSAYVAWKRAIVDAGVTDRALYTRQKSVFVEAVLSLPEASGRPPLFELARRLSSAEAPDGTTPQTSGDRSPDSNHEQEQ